jgi:hypothetical protein
VTQAKRTAFFCSSVALRLSSFKIEVCQNVETKDKSALAKSCGLSSALSERAKLPEKE